MKIAVSSGKGGTGKTLFSLGLAAAVDEPVQLLDCDVEEPNCHLFLDCEADATESVTLLAPELIRDRCTVCGDCSDVCRYNAIATMNAPPLLFTAMCHGCGGCVQACPHGALTEAPREVGQIEHYQQGPLELLTGRLHIGEAMAPLVIRAVRKKSRPDGLCIIDSPPGVSCAAVAAVRDVDFVCLITEPTPFGLHDLKLMMTAVQAMGLPYGVVINKAVRERPLVRDYCRDHGARVLGELAESRQVAAAYARGRNPFFECAAFRDGVQTIWESLFQRVTA